MESEKTSDERLLLLKELNVITNDEFEFLKYFDALTSVDQESALTNIKDMVKNS